MSNNPSPKVLVAIAEKRAAVLQKLHDYVIQYGIENKMTCDELTTLMAGLMIRTSAGPQELGAALGTLASKCLVFSSHSLAQVPAEGNA